MQILPDISRSKGNELMKFGQLIEYNMRNDFAEIEHIRGSIVRNVKVCFNCMFKSRSTKIYYN